MPRNNLHRSVLYPPICLQTRSVLESYAKYSRHNEISPETWKLFECIEVQVINQENGSRLKHYSRYFNVR